MTPRYLLPFAIPVFFALSACGPADEPSEPPEPIEPSSVESQRPEAETTQPETGSETIALSERLAALNALTVQARIKRDSEMGHAAYDPELSGEPMGRAARRWLELFEQVQSFWVDGRLHPELIDGEPQGSTRLADYADAAYAYHMHHSGGRFEAHGLFEAITHQPSAFLTRTGQYLLENYFEDGRFRAGGDGAADMAYGLDAFHGLAYAWIRWHKPGGADDMGQIDRQAMVAWMGHEPEELLAMARASSKALDDAWDESAGSYDFGNQSHWKLGELASLLRGHKGVYELLYVFGGTEDQERAERLFTRAADLAEALFDESVLQPWGLPAELRFENGRAHAVSEIVDGEAQWRLVHHLTGGFALLREREGTARFIERTRPELTERLGVGIDSLLQGGLDYHLDGEGEIARTLDHESGQILETAPGVPTRSAFIMAAGNGYRAGTAFDRPGAWVEDQALANRSRTLYQTITRLAD